MTASVTPPLLFGQVLLPPLAERQVLQHWRIVTPTVNVFRSIEFIHGSYFMVARGIDSEGIPFGGEHGLPLVRESPTDYRLANGSSMRYQIAETGDLLGFAEGESEASIRCIPVQDLPAAFAQSGGA
jgi:hypothetical protein